MKKGTNDIKVLVCCHKKTEFPKGEIYLPVQVGALRSDIDLGIQTDCEVNGCLCDNISCENNIYCEMTASYWAWKNINKLFQDIQYIGLCHYRRYFNAGWNFWDKGRYAIKCIRNKWISMATNTVLTTEPVRVIDSLQEKEFINNTSKLENVIRNHDVVSTYPCKITNCNTEFFFQIIGQVYIRVLTEVVDSLFPKYSLAYHEQLKSSEIYAQNMVVMRMEIFDEYCTFVFSVLSEHKSLIKEKNICIDPSSEGIYDRVSGYLAEILTSTFVRYAITKYDVGFVGKYFLNG